VISDRDWIGAISQDFALRKIRGPSSENFLLNGHVICTVSPRKAVSLFNGKCSWCKLSEGRAEVLSSVESSTRYVNCPLKVTSINQGYQHEQPKRRKHGVHGTTKKACRHSRLEPLQHVIIDFISAPPLN